MPEISTTIVVAITVLAVTSALLVWAGVMLWRRIYGSSWMVLKRIGRERLDDVVIPDGVEGEIHLEHLLLTDRGLLVLELRNARGALFAGERLDEWRVIDGGRRFTFRNPLPPLEARVRSVDLIADGLPVVGRVAIVGEVSFAGGRPERVTTLAELAHEFAAGKPDADTHAEAVWRRIVAVARPARH